MPINVNRPRRHERLPVTTGFRTHVPGLDVRNTETGELYTMGEVEDDAIILIDDVGDECRVSMDDFEDRYELR